MPAKKSTAKKAAKPAAKKSANKTSATKKAVKQPAAAHSKDEPTTPARRRGRPPRQPADPAVNAGAAPVTPQQAMTDAANEPVLARKKASEFLKRPSHTPAIFKPTRRHTQIIFSIEDLREVLKKRQREEQRLADESAKAATAMKAPRVAQNVAVAPAKVTAATNPASVTPQAPVATKRAAASLADILGLSKGPAASGTSSGKTVPAKFQKYYDLLVELRREVSEELALHSKETLKRSQKEDSGDLSISVDAGTDSFDRDFALSMLSTEQEALKEIEAAIQRIYKGTYGVCEVTGEPIKAERLEAVPFTRFSLEGQKQHEATHRRRVDRGGTFLNEGGGETISFGDDDGDN